MLNEQRLDEVVRSFLWCQKGKPMGVKKIRTGLKAILPTGMSEADGVEFVRKSLERLEAAGEVAPQFKPVKSAKKPSTKPPAVAGYTLTESGAAAARQRSGRKEPATWKATLEGEILGVALGVPGFGTLSTAAAGKLLPIAVCAGHFGLSLPLDRGPDVAKLEAVKLALADANHVDPAKVNLKKIPTGELPALVVGPMLGRSNSPLSLDALFTSVAGEIVGVAATSAQLKQVVVRRWLADGRSSSPNPVRTGESAENSGETEPSSDASTPDDQAFCLHVVAAASDVARQGGPDVNYLRDRVLTKAAWRRYQERFGPIPFDRFKSRLAESNGVHIVLVREDLVPEDRRQAYEESEVRLGVSRYHYVQVPSS